jgi:cytochrome c-type biogenesis protein CcmE
VLEGSIKRGGGTDVGFAITDKGSTIEVTYRGVLPDLFREGQGVVAEGRIDPAGIFRADTVLAKHDENYMPPEAADALAKARKGQLPNGAMTVSSDEATQKANP